jgi:predicted HAD superfamily Cof-like phosphohydrolase
MTASADSITRTLAFFEGAIPEPTPQNVTTQMGVHFEEFVEMLQEISSDNHNTKYVIAHAINAVSMLSTHFKSNPGCAFVGEEDRQLFLDALCDQIVTATGCAHMLKMQIDGAMAEVNTSNLSKFGEDGKPIFDENKKIMKGPKYFKPNLAPFV